MASGDLKLVLSLWFRLPRVEHYNFTSIIFLVSPNKKFAVNRFLSFKLATLQGLDFEVARTGF